MMGSTSRRRPVTIPGPGDDPAVTVQPLGKQGVAKKVTMVTVFSLLFTSLTLALPSLTLALSLILD
jgi:hypothetical protein